MVARSFRDTLEQVAGTIPDLVMLGIGIAVFVWAIAPVLQAVASVKSVISGS